ncbi:MAG: hypothetical protein HOY78_02605 [Saccharothrix sp.]|nr:hypothetical protein [Saccharothrix sp.]
MNKYEKAVATAGQILAVWDDETRAGRALTVGDITHYQSDKDNPAGENVVRRVVNEMVHDGLLVSARGWITARHTLGRVEGITVRRDNATYYAPAGSVDRHRAVIAEAENRIKDASRAAERLRAALRGQADRIEIQPDGMVRATLTVAQVDVLIALLGTS